MKIKATFRGDGTAFYQGIPARDLTEEEFERLSMEQRELLRKSPLYVVHRQPKKEN